MTEPQFEEQKKNCPFCKIISGEIPSKKIYESKNDDFEKDVIAILDINPLTEGHTLVMPKEHYPILPLLPANTFNEIFKVCVGLSEVLRNVLLKQGSTIFIANGAAAGQQSSHFMAHVIPRNENEATNFNFQRKEVDQQNLEQIRDKFSKIISIMFQKDYNKYPLKDNNGNIIKLGFTDNLEIALSVLEQNPKLKDLLIENKDEFIKIINADERAKSIFSNINIDELIEKVTGKKQPEIKSNNKNTQDTTTTQNTTINEPKTNQTLTPMDVALSVMNESPKLTTLLINNPDEFIKVVNADEQAKIIFGKIDLNELRNILSGKNEVKNNHENQEYKKQNSDNNQNTENKNNQDNQDNNTEEQNKNNLDKISELFK